MGEVILVGDQMRPLVDGRPYETMNLDTSFRTFYWLHFKETWSKVCVCCVADIRNFYL